jgi:hypothetical protein
MQPERLLPFSQHPATCLYILSHINPVHTLPYHFIKNHFNIILLSTRRPSSLFTSHTVPTKASYAILISHMRATCPAHLVLDLITTWCMLMITKCEAPYRVIKEKINPTVFF